MCHPFHAVIRTWTRLALHIIAAFTAVAVASVAAVTLLRAMSANPGPWTCGLAVVGAVVGFIFAACSGERGAR